MDELAEPLQHLRVAAVVNLAPVELRAFEGLHLFGVGDLFRPPAKGGEVATAALGNGARHLRVVVMGEVLEWGRSGELFPLKEHGNEWRGEYESRGYLCAVDADDVFKAVACRPVAHLVVILNIAKEAVRGEPFDGTAVTAAPVARIGSVIDEDTGEGFGELLEGTKVLVVALARFRVENGEESVVEVI